MSSMSLEQSLELGVWRSLTRRTEVHYLKCSTKSWSISTSQHLVSPVTLWKCKTKTWEPHRWGFGYWLVKGKISFYANNITTSPLLLLCKSKMLFTSPDFKRIHRFLYSHNATFLSQMSQFGRQAPSFKPNLTILITSITLKNSSRLIGDIM